MCNKSEILVDEGKLLDWLEFTKISSGHSYVHLITYEGDLYGFGDDFTEIYNDDGFKSKIPIKFNDSENLIELASHPIFGISAAVSSGNIYFTWEIVYKILSKRNLIHFLIFSLKNMA